MDKNNLIEKYLTEVQSIDFPLIKLSEDRLKEEYSKLFSNSDPKPASNMSLDLVYHFHPSIWRCNRHGYKSPIEGWNDPVIMGKVIENRLNYIGEDLTPQHLRKGLTVGMFAPKVSVFRPMTAKYLIKKYLNDYNTIFDPCMGFSGRMLGAISLNKHYIGYDINSMTIKEAKSLQQQFNFNAEIQRKDSLYETGEFECLFTCPPYGNKENWHQDIEELSVDEWIETCLKNYKCKTYLFVVDKTEKYKDFVVEQLSNKSHLNSQSELVILIKAA